MPRSTASAAGRFKLGGDIDIARLGYGAMCITGDGISGEPEDRAASSQRDHV